MTEQISVMFDTNGSCGVIAYWELEGHVQVDALRAALADHGLERHAPAYPSVASAVHRAAIDAAGNAGKVMVRSVNRRRWEAFAQHIVPDIEDGAGRITLTSIAVGGTKKSETGTDVAFARSTNGAAGSEFAQHVDELYGWHQSTLDAGATSSWLIGAAQRCGAVALRKAGGFYFVPADRIAEWRQVVACLRICSRAVVHEIPAQRSEECVQSVLHALRHEAEQALRDAAEYLEGDTTRSSRGVLSTRAKIAALRDKLRGYATLLGAGLTDIEARADEVDGLAVLAEMVLARPE